MACLKPAPVPWRKEECRGKVADEEDGMRIFPVILLIGLASPALAQDAKPAEEEEITVVGIRDGAKVVEVDFD